MKKKIAIVTAVIICLFIICFTIYINSYFLSEAEPENISDEYDEEGFQKIAADRWDMEFNMLKDPATGKIPHRAKEKELDAAKKIKSREEISDNAENLNTYTSLGPKNIGGRTRAVVFDKTNPDVILAGAVSSGIFKSVNGGSTWVNKTPANEIHNVTCIAQDPRNNNTKYWYFGTGENYGNSASGRGAFYHGQGIYKSDNFGDNWTKLTSTSSTLESFNSPFDFVHRIVVNPSNGQVYAACYNVILRSGNGGTSWDTVLGSFRFNPDNPRPTGFTDIVCSSDGSKLYAAICGNESLGNDGVWFSNNGNSGNWTKIAGNGSPAGWRTTNNYGRIVLAMAPSNENLLFALYYNGDTNKCPPRKIEADLFKYNRQDSAWTNLSANLPDENPGGNSCVPNRNPFSVQGGYDLCISVKPDNADFILVGGTNAYRSTNGFTNPNATKHIGGYSTLAYTSRLHPDIHTFTFHPTSTDYKIVFAGSDGGISKTSNITADNVSWDSLNKDYTTLQYYYVSCIPDEEQYEILGGSQDNGTTRSLSRGTKHDSFWGGDGFANGLSQSFGKDGDYGEKVYKYVSIQFGNITRMNRDYPYLSTAIRPSACDTANFRTYFLLDPDNPDILYYAGGKKSENNNLGKTLWRTTNASTVTPADGWTELVAVDSNITSMAVTRERYSAGSKLYIGTDNGMVYRINDPKNSNGNNIKNITGNGMPKDAYVSWISVHPLDDKKVLVVFSNYNVKSIWYTENGDNDNPTWTDLESNAVNAHSVRSCMIVSRNGKPTEYYLGTSVGLYSTNALDGQNTVWVKEGVSEIKYSVVSSMAYRPRDNFLLTGTHGNGMFWTKVPDPDYMALRKKSASQGRRQLGGYQSPEQILFNDTATVYIRTNVSPYEKIDSSTKYVDVAGIGDFKFYSPRNGTGYYLQVRHRNSIETWSSSPVYFNNDSLYFDFTDSQSKAFGNNMIPVGGVWCFYSGDVNQDGVIDVSDITYIDNDAFNFVIGYVITDLTGDNLVDALDLIIADNNTFNYVVAVWP